MKVIVPYWRPFAIWQRDGLGGWFPSRWGEKWFGSKAEAEAAIRAAGQEPEA